MKRIVTILVIILVLLFIMTLLSKNQRGEPIDNETATEENFEIIPISHASAILDWDGTIIYSDPVGDSSLYADYPNPDIVFLTHEHGDHFNEETLSEVLSENSTLIVPQAVADLIEIELPGETVILANSENFEKNNFSVLAVPSYNIREEALDRHPEGIGNGYVIEHDGKKVYFSGDSEDTREMRALENIDVAFVAMNLPYTMSVESAADAVLEFKPKTIYPYHYRTPEGFSDVEKFKEIVKAGDPEIEVILLDWYAE